MIVYDRPLLYDIAFGYRDTVAEADGLLSFFERARGRPAHSVLELGAGPAFHALAFARRGLDTSALDRSGAMCVFAREKAGLLGFSLETHEADMVDFRLDRRFDLIVTPGNSIAHLHDLDTLVEHLRSVASHLAADGLYVFEGLHPRHFLGRGPRSNASLEPWTISRWGLEVQTHWGRPDDPYDPLSQIFEATVQMTVRDADGHVQTFTELVRMKDWTRNELLAAIRLSDRLECIGVFGDPALSTPCGPESEAMVLACVPSP